MLEKLNLPQALLRLRFGLITAKRTSGFLGEHRIFPFDLFDHTACILPPPLAPPRAGGVRFLPLPEGE